MSKACLDNDLRQRPKNFGKPPSKNWINPASCRRNASNRVSVEKKKKKGKKKARERKAVENVPFGKRTTPFLRLFPPLEEESVNRPLITNEKDSLYLRQTPESGGRV